MSLSASEVKSKLKLALIFEYIVPFALTVGIFFFCYYILNSDIDFKGEVAKDPEYIVNHLRAPITITLSVLTLVFISKIVFTILSMEAALEFFRENKDLAYVKEIESARLVYIIVNVLMFIPLIQSIVQFALCYNLSVYFKVKDRLNEALSSVSYFDPQQPKSDFSNKSTVGRVILSVLLFLVLLVAIIIAGICVLDPTAAKIIADLAKIFAAFAKFLWESSK